MKQRDRHNPAEAPLDRDVPTMPAFPAREPRRDAAALETAVFAQLAETLAAQPAALWRAIADAAMAACDSRSAGVCLLEPDGKTLRRRGTVGHLASLEGSTVPLRASPCRTVFEHRVPQWIVQPAESYRGFAGLDPPVDEMLLAPVLDDGIPVGSVWVAAHRGHARPFDADDTRVLSRLARIAAAGVRRSGSVAASDEARRDSEAEFRAIFEATSVGVAQADAASGRIVRVNGRLSRMLGYGEDALVGRPFADLAYRDDRGHSQAGYLQLTRGEIPTFDLELRMPRQDGRLRWVLMSMTLIRGARGAPRGVMALAMDITQRKHAEEALAASRQQLRLALDASHLALWESDMKASRMDWSPAVFELTGVPRQAFDASADSLKKWVHADDASIVGDALQRAAHGQAFQIEYRIVRPDGQVRWVAQHGRVLRDRHGMPHRMIGTVADITGRKTFEDELRRARDELESSVHERTLELARAIASLRSEVSERSGAEQRVRSLLSRLVGAVEDERQRISRELHDTLGQHLSVLTLGLQTLSRAEGASPPLRTRIGELLAAAQAMEDEVDRISHELRPLALDELGLEDALRRHAEAWSAECGIAVDLHTHGLHNGRLAPTIESTVYRVVQESLTNVRRHARAQRVSLIAERRANELRLIVEDDGQGFDPRAAEPDGDTRGRLGLKGMSERAALVGGHLQIESTPRCGTTIYLLIPLDSTSWTFVGGSV